MLGAYDVTANFAGSTDYTAASSTLDFTVAQVPLTITANSTSWIYGSPQSLTYTETGLQNGETIGNVVLVTNATTSGSRNLNTGTWTITPSDATGGTFNPSNYSITYTPGSLTVTPASISGWFSASNKVYDGTTTATVTNSGTNAISGDNVQLTYTGATFASANVGLQPVAITNPGITGSDAGDYTLVSVAPEYATITPAPLTITANNDSGTYGVPPLPGLNGVSYTGFVDGQTLSVLTTLPTVTTTATSTSPVGSYPITVTGAVDSDYAISYEPGTYTVTPAALTVLSFEQPVVGASTFKYDPTGSPWVFTGGAGISSNNSGFTSGNPPAPQGTQVAFLQGTGTITQNVINWAAGSYVLTFDAAQRGNFGLSQQNFEVLIDGVIVGTFIPSGTSYQTYSTVVFTVIAGAHTIEFKGLDSAGGDNTAFIDAVSIS